MTMHLYTIFLHYTGSCPKQKARTSKDKGRQHEVFWPVREIQDNNGTFPPDFRII